MSISCKLGLHSWNGCSCIRCQRVRDNQHDWSYNCDKCSICGSTRQNSHQMDGCVCLICGYSKHNFEHGACINCGTLTRDGVLWKAPGANSWFEISCTIKGSLEHLDQGFSKVWKGNVEQAKSFIQVIDSIVSQTQTNSLDHSHNEKGVVKLHENILNHCNSISKSELKDFRFFLRLVCDTMLYSNGSKIMNEMDQLIIAILIWIGDCFNDVLRFINAMQIATLQSKVILTTAWGLESPFISNKSFHVDMIKNTLSNLLQRAINHAYQYGPDNAFLLQIVCIKDIINTILIPDYNSTQVKNVIDSLKSISMNRDMKGLASSFDELLK